MLIATQAWELLNNPEYSSKLRMVDFYELMVRAGYTRVEAQKAANVRGWERLKAGMTV